MSLYYYWRYIEHILYFCFLFWGTLLYSDFCTNTSFVLFIFCIGKISHKVRVFPFYGNSYKCSFVSCISTLLQLLGQFKDMWYWAFWIALGFHENSFVLTFNCETDCFPNGDVNYYLMEVLIFLDSTVFENWQQVLNLTKYPSEMCLK